MKDCFRAWVGLNILHQKSLVSYFYYLAGFWNYHLFWTATYPSIFFTITKKDFIEKKFNLSTKILENLMKFNR
ncbi:hypothetical protein [Thermodesulfatator indicus]|uniref:hypothetical protein n=1 Tax=Thermodesulfatator indicus TaxID=171695 RepID=UPI0002FD0B33|nr:hypothetical protein [Thermodesulfatator indicus]